MHLKLFTLGHSRAKDLLLNFSYRTFCIFLILFGLIQPGLYSQYISGRIFNGNNDIIPVANIIIKDSSNGQIKEYTLARNGQYSISLAEKYQKIIIEVLTNKYLKDTWIIENPDSSKHYIHNFILQRDSSTQLKEVIVTAKQKAIQVKDDTVKYNVSAFRDGTERKIEDLIKKLPGITVDEKTGAITYKGKSIETVKLEGDDLFGYNYMTGTRNINVDMVDQVQAIDNYSDNPLLKGIEHSDKVILNLTLKKDRLDISGDINTGLGYANEGKVALDEAANILAITKKNKAFGTLSYNNTGTNYSPYDYFSYARSAEQLKEADLKANKVIPETIFPDALDEKRANINSAWFINYNEIFKIARKLSLKTNFYYLRDKIKSNQLFENNNLINTQQISTSDDYNIEKKPVQYRADAEIKYAVSQNSLLEYKLRLAREEISTSANVIQNKISNYQTDLQSKDINTIQSLLFTHRISQKKALQVSLTHSSDNIVQNYFMTPALYEPSTFSSNNQFSNFKKNITSFQSIILGSTTGGKYSFSIDANLTDNPFVSTLTGNDKNTSTNISGFENSFMNKNYSVANKGTYVHTFGKFRIYPSYSLTYLYQKLSDHLNNQFTDKTSVLFEPVLKLNYQINNVSGIFGVTSYSQKPFSEQYLFGNPVYASTRATVYNLPGLQLQKTSSFAAFYAINNLYKQFVFNAGLSYLVSRGNYFSDIYVQENSTSIRYFYLPQKNKIINADFLIQKYIPALQSTIRFKSNYSISGYKNIVNNSSLRNNVASSFYAELFIKTAFNGKINVENIFHYTTTNTKTEMSEIFINKAINNTFRIISHPVKKWLVVLSDDFFLPDTKHTHESYSFVDASIRFTPKTKGFNFEIAGKNLLNQSSFTQVTTSDFSKTVFQYNLLSRYIMLKVSHNF